MLTHRPAADRGHSLMGWLDSYHSFSFGDYDDPAHRQFRALRVINDDRIAGGGGFPTHPHRDMEILTWVLAGGLRHRDSLGHESTLGPGKVQLMHAGTGIAHSEFNASETEPLHLLQIWLMPQARGLAPGYAEQVIPDDKLVGRFCLLASPDGRDGSLKIYQDCRIWATRMQPEQYLILPLLPGRFGWVQMARGKVWMQKKSLVAGDGMAAEGEARLEFMAETACEFLVFDLA